MKETQEHLDLIAADILMLCRDVKNRCSYLASANQPGEMSILRQRLRDVLANTPKPNINAL